MPHHCCQRNFLGRERQTVASGDTALALHETSRLKIVEYLLEESLWDVLLLGDCPDPHLRLTVVQAQYQ